MAKNQPRRIDRSRKRLSSRLALDDDSEGRRDAKGCRRALTNRSSHEAVAPRGHQRRRVEGDPSVPGADHASGQARTGLARAVASKGGQTAMVPDSRASGEAGVGESSDVSTAGALRAAAGTAVDRETQIDRLRNALSFADHVLVDALSSSPALVDDVAELVRMLVALVRAATVAERLAPQLGLEPATLSADAFRRVRSAVKAASGRSSNERRLAAALELLDRFTIGSDLISTAIAVARARGDQTPVLLASLHGEELRELAKGWRRKTTDPRSRSKYARLSDLLSAIGVRIPKETIKKHATARKTN